MPGFATVFGAARSLISPTTDIQFSDNVTWLKGAHTLKVGGLVIRNRKDQNGRSLYAGQVDFNTGGNTQHDGQRLRRRAARQLPPYTEAQYDPMGFFRFWQAEAFVSDNWRVSRNLSIEAGMRYTWHQPMYTQANNMASFDPAALRSGAGGDRQPQRDARARLRRPLQRPRPRRRGRSRGRAVPRAQRQRRRCWPCRRARRAASIPNRHLFAPRFSFAWTPSGNSETAVRGGFGLFYDRPEGNLLFGGGGNGPVNSPPYVLSSQYENGNLSAPGGGSVPAPAPLGQIASIDPNLKVPRSWNWSVSVQRELPWGIFGEIGYVGSKGQNLLRQPDINQPSFEALAPTPPCPRQRANTNFLRPYKGYSQIRMRLTDGDSSYHALQVYLSRRTRPPAVDGELHAEPRARQRQRQRQTTQRTT